MALRDLPHLELARGIRHLLLPNNMIIILLTLITIGKQHLASALQKDKILNTCTNKTTIQNKIGLKAEEAQEAKIR